MVDMQDVQWKLKIVNNYLSVIRFGAWKLNNNRKKIISPFNYSFWTSRTWAMTSCSGNVSPPPFLPPACPTKPVVLLAQLRGKWHVQQIRLEVETISAVPMMSEKQNRWPPWTRPAHGRRVDYHVLDLNTLVPLCRMAVTGVLTRERKISDDCPRYPRKTGSKAV